MTKATGTILSDIYDAWRAQDLDWLASYLPDDFLHIMHIPPEIFPLGGACQGKMRVLERWRLTVPHYEFLRFEASTLLHDNHCAAAEISLQYRHRETGTLLDTTKANFWLFEAGWPVKLTEYYDVTHIRALTAALAARREA